MRLDGLPAAIQRRDKLLPIVTSGKEVSRAASGHDQYARPAHLESEEGYVQIRRCFACLFRKDSTQQLLHLHVILHHGTIHNTGSTNRHHHRQHNRRLARSRTLP